MCLPLRLGVLITRPEPGATGTAARIAALGLEPIVSPLLTIRPLAAHLPDPTSVQAVLVTSGHAVDNLPATHRAPPLLAVGDATAERARRAGHRRVFSADGDAASLATLAVQLCHPGAAPLLLAVGRGLGKPLEAALRDHGFRIDRREVYAVDPVPLLPETARRSLAEHQVSAALFFSGDTARAFVRLIALSDMAEDLAGVEALAISENVAALLTPLPWRRVRAALRPNQDEVLALLA